MGLKSVKTLILGDGMTSAAFHFIIWVKNETRNNKLYNLTNMLFFGLNSITKTLIIIRALGLKMTWKVETAVNNSKYSDLKNYGILYFNLQNSPDWRQLYWKCWDHPLSHK